MAFRTIISSYELARHLEDPNWAILDCRFSLANSERGRQEYLSAHIPGAVYIHLNEDLCAPIVPGETGRHPLPAIEKLVEKFSSWGICPGVQAVVYDDWTPASGAIAARLWWSLRYLGFDNVAVLDGGWQVWVSEGKAVRSGVETRSRCNFKPALRPELLITTEEVAKLHNDPRYKVFDSRSSDRYRGENETIDPVAGHIPGAFSAPYSDTVGPEGKFLPPEVLQKHFLELFGDVPAEHAIFYCGSGVTAAHNLVALAHCGLGEAPLYVGSWSEWITHPENPTATGSTPG